MSVVNHHTRDTQDVSCLYNDERIRIFFIEIKTIINDCFHSLHETVHAKFSDPREQKSRLLRGLQFVSTDMNRESNYSEIARVTHTFPRIKENYRRAITRFARYVIPREFLHLEIQCPSFDGFLFALYKRVASSFELRSGRYFAMTYTEQEVFLKDILRVTMSSCLDYGADTTKHVMPDDSVSNIVPNTRRAQQEDVVMASILEEAISVATSVQPSKKDETLSAFLTRQEQTSSTTLPRDCALPLAQPPATPLLVFHEKEIEINSHANSAMPTTPSVTSRASLRARHNTSTSSRSRTGSRIKKAHTDVVSLISKVDVVSRTGGIDVSSRTGGGDVGSRTGGGDVGSRTGGGDVGSRTGGDMGLRTGGDMGLRTGGDVGSRTGGGDVYSRTGGGDVGSRTGGGDVYSRTGGGDVSSRTGVDLGSRTGGIDVRSLTGGIDVGSRTGGIDVRSHNGGGGDVGSRTGGVDVGSRTGGVATREDVPSIAPSYSVSRVRSVANDNKCRFFTEETVLKTSETPSEIVFL